MFYSHNLLAQNGPLGTIWLATHPYGEQKLKKSHYAVTDISSSVDRIMFPEVPIALRMSAHLLLGVVRIYSKKVDYLLHDCNVVNTTIGKAFASIEVNLPEDATHAPFHSITLPETFELDAFDLGDDLYHEGAQDNYLRSQEEITITDQIPVEGDLYVAFDINEDIMMDISNPPEVSEIGVSPMEEDVPPSIPVGNSVGVSDPGPSNQAEAFSGRLHEDHFSQNLPEIEVMRDVVHNFGPENLSVLPDLDNDSFEQNIYMDQTTNEKDTLSPIMEDMPVSGGQSLPFQLHPEPPPSVSSEEAPGLFNSRISLGHISPELVIQPTPPVEKPKPRRRQRKQLYDEFMKKALEDPSDLPWKKKRCLPLVLDVWKFNNSLRNEQIFFEPSIFGERVSPFAELISLHTRQCEPLRNCSYTNSDVYLFAGFCPNLQNISKKETISSKSQLDHVEDALPEPRNAQSHAPMPDLDMDIERLQRDDHTGSNILHEFMLSPSRSMHSPFRGDDFAPFYTDNIGSEPQMETTVRIEVLPTPDIEGPTGPFGLELETPLTFLREQLGMAGTGLSDIPEWLNSAVEDLNFLEADNTPAGSQGNEEVETLSVRTRAVAQYLKRKSPATQISEEQSGNLSLNKILEGKTRKLCAQMFFETLVTPDTFSSSNATSIFITS
ncbi:hypothetical protein HHK36_017397 [Tetracentron sinense]|uniref:Uncharacterized protein n=1 Tax=Tetracentron sinense TaxID=13715 RepID=A0A834YYS9_TETSI|nr:hypothetical protein HHK36_017397 [Tetracentron sinense]